MSQWQFAKCLCGYLV